MNKWNCLIIDDTISHKKQEDKINAPDGLSVKKVHWNSFHRENFEDFDIFFINFEDEYSFNYDQTKALLELKSGELKQLKFIFASKINSVIKPAVNKEAHPFDLISNLWKGIPKSFNKEGNKIILINPNYSLSKLLFLEKFRPFHWKWSIKSEELPNNSYGLVKNKKGNIISLIVRYENNFLIFLPHPSSKLDFIETCLININKFELELFNRGFDIPIKKPKWIEDYDPFNKTSLISKLHNIEEKIQKIETYEILLYGYGKPLENSISNIISFLGFQNLTQTVDRADLLCETENTKIIAEIKGLKDIAHERNISQMYKWHLEELQKEEESVKKIKQIFICNSYRNIKPEERGNFFDQKIINISESHEWGLLSTLELYKSLLKIWNGELTKEEVSSIIENQIGVIKINEL